MPDVEALDEILANTPEVDGFGYLLTRILNIDQMGPIDIAKAYNYAAVVDTTDLAEHHIYGSSRLGVQKYPAPLYRQTFNIDTTIANLKGLSTDAPWYSLFYSDLIKPAYKDPFGHQYTGSTDTLRLIRKLGYRHYEMTDHLGNVLATVLDRKTGHNPGGGATKYDYYLPDLSSAQDYYPFGMRMPQRHKEINDTLYRFGFNSQEKDNDIAGVGNHFDFKFRGYDPRVGRFWSVDPIAAQYPWNSTYAFAENSPIQGIDLEGKELLKVNSGMFRMNIDNGIPVIDVVNANTSPIIQGKFSAAGVGLTPGGYDRSLSSGSVFRPSNDLPQSPRYPWLPLDAPEQTNNTAGGRMGTNVNDNRAFADRHGSVAATPKEFHNWKETFVGDNSNINKWNALGDLGDNIRAFSTAIGIVAGTSPTDIGFQNAANPQFGADLTNFIYDGTVPSVDFGNVNQSLDYRESIMRNGMKIMGDNQINIQSATKSAYQNIPELKREFGNN